MLAASGLNFGFKRSIPHILGIGFGFGVMVMLVGFEKQYGHTARKIKAPSNMIVSKVFYRGSFQADGVTADDWAEIYVVFFNEELQRYDLLVLPRYHTQNSYVGFEYVYDKDMLRRLREENATFSKGEVFAHSPNVGETGEWNFGIDALVCGLTADYTEEDGIAVTDYFIEKITTMFEHRRKHSWNESEFIPLNLYGTPEHPRPFPENGETVRDDGIVMGFRRRNTSSALVSLTKEALMRPDPNYDILLYAPANSVVKSIIVTTERYKNRSHNKSAEKITQPHTELLERYEGLSNRMANDVSQWCHRLESKFREDEDLPITNELNTFLTKQLGSVTKDLGTGKYNMTKRTDRNKSLLDWNVEVILKERVRGKKRFKLTDTQGASLS